MKTRFFKRAINIKHLLDAHSLFLFGPRQSGKTTFLLRNFPHAHFVNLLEADTYRRLSSRPELLRQSTPVTAELLIIDEIQKIPALLDEVQNMIFRNRALRVILTGSSARRLKTEGVNLLGGRALRCNIHPLTYPETGVEFLEKRILIGSLPPVLNSPVPHEVLDAYTGLYLQEEIRGEGLVRKVERFSRFLDVAALSNGEQVNFESVAQQTGIPSRTVIEYFRILQDTLLAFELPSFRGSRKRKARAKSKFFLFDTGVANNILNRTHLALGTPEFGKAFEHLVFLELKAYVDYNRLRSDLTYWRSTSNFEVDFLLGTSIGIEVKSAETVTSRMEKGLHALDEELQLKRKIIVCREPWRRTTDSGIEIFPLEQFLHSLWDGEFDDAL